MAEEDIPRPVIEQLAKVRAGGRSNMMHQSEVIMEISYVNPEASKWLTANRSRYLEALIIVGNEVE